MPLDDTHALCVLSTLPSGSWELDEDKITRAESGWDTMRRRYLRDYGTDEVDAIDVDGFDIGDRIGSLNFWVVESTPTRLGGNIWAMDVLAHGLAAARPPKIRGGATMYEVKGSFEGESYTVEIIGHEAQPELEAQYILIGSAPETDLVGLEGEPPVEIAIRDPRFPIAGQSGERHNIPYGWILADLPYDTIPGTNVHLVTERWQYFWQYTAA